MNIQVDKLCFRYNQIEPPVAALDQVSFSLQTGECVALVGPSGSGKSTLAQHLNGLLKPDSGSIRIDGKLLGWSARELRDLRRRVGLVFQFPEAQIFEGDVFSEVAFAAYQWGIPREEIRGKVERALHSVGLEAESFYDRNPLKLSGGETRLISIASLLVVDPDWLILDEPTLGLDFAHWQCIRDLILQRLKASRSVLLITHDLNLVLQVCPRILVLDQGRIKYDGDSFQLLISNDLCEKLDLIRPDVVRLWEALKSSLVNGADRADFPEPDAMKIESWIKGRSRVEREKACSVLLHQLNKSLI